MTEPTRVPGAFYAPFVLAVDVGSSSLKAALFDSRARMLDYTAVRVSHRIHATPDGGVEEVPDHLVSNVEEAIDGVMQRAGTESEMVAAVGMDTMASTVMGVDGHGRAVTPIYTYADTRPQQDVDAIREVHRRGAGAPTNRVCPASVLSSGTVQLAATHRP